MNDKYGYTTLQSDKAALLHELDSDFVRMAENYKINKWFVPALIDGQVLRRCGYFSTLPNHLTKVGYIKRDRLRDISNDNDSLCDDDFDNSTDVYLTPAACLHFYPVLEEFPVHNEIITTFARVYRYEDGKFSPLERQWDFTVREFVAVGSVDYVNSFLTDMEDKLLNYALNIYRDIAVEEANDHFYPTKDNKLKERFQIKNNLKHELVAHIESLKLAISSFNYHGLHFSKIFNFDGNEKIVTGCIGCGLERWIRLFEV